MLENDWLVAGLNNPTFTNSDFSDIAGLTTDNTQLLSKEDYLKSDFIRNHPLFRDEKGNFSEQRFSDYYAMRTRDFYEFQQGDFAKGPALDMFDIMQTPDSKIKDIHFDIKRGVNPDRQAIGIEGVNIWSDPKYSQREIAKQNKVFNTATGEFEDYTVNDHTLVNGVVNWVKDLFKDPLVLATWDEDGTHLDPITGIEKEHKKGDAKLNDKGTYYYETLNGRSIMGKDVLSVFDTFTVDGQGLNKYDFFDSNDIKKGVRGTIAKNVVALLPMFMGPIGEIYAAGFVAREMAKSLPMLYGFLTALTDDTSTPAVINWLATAGNRLSSSTSDYAKQNTFAFENFGNLISDVALQWGQQKFIAKAFGRMKGANSAVAEAKAKAEAQFQAKLPQFIGREEELAEVCRKMYVEPALKVASQSGQFGRDMSLAYMAIISNTDVYEDMLDHGASKTEAAAVALGSTLGMFAVDKYLHLGEVFFDEATPDAAKQARQAIRNEVRQARGAFDNIKGSDLPARNKILQYMKKASDLGKKVITRFGEDLKYHSLGVTGKMIGEGLEEVSEELVTDTCKSMYELAGQLGFNTSTQDVGAWDNAFDRYVMNFLGGAIGGGIFYGVEAWNGKTFYRPKNDEELATLIRNGHADELRDQLASMAASGKTGSKKLSAYDYSYDSNGKLVWRTATDPTRSQGEVIANIIKDRINTIEEVLLANRFNLTDDELFDNMVLSESRYRRYQDISETTNYYDDFNKLINDVIQAEQDLKTALKTVDGTPKGAPIPNDNTLNHLSKDQADQREQNINELRNNVEAARERVRAFLSGETSLDYTRKLNFILDPVLHSPFLAVNKDEYLQQKYPGKTYEQLTPEEQLRFDTQEWPDYVKEQLKTKATEAWAQFKELEKDINPFLDQLAQDTPTYRTWEEGIRGLFNGELLDSLRKSYVHYNMKLDGESDDDFANRDQRVIDPKTGELETVENFNIRRNNRYRRIAEYNDQQDQIWADRVLEELRKVDMVVDPQTARMLRRVLPDAGRIRAVIMRKIMEASPSPIVANVLKSLKPDLSNVDELTQALRDPLKDRLMKSADEAFKTLADLTVTLGDGSTMSLHDYVDLYLDDLLDVYKEIHKDDKEAQELTSLSLVDLWEAINFSEAATITTPAVEESTEESPELEPIPENNEQLLTPESKSYILNTLNELFANNVAELAEMDALDVTDGDNSYTAKTIEGAIDERVEQYFEATQNTINTIVASIRNNPLVKLQGTLKTSLVNPIANLIKSIAAKRGDTLTDVDEALGLIQDDFDNMINISELILTDPQRNNLEKIKNYLELLKTYIYAASTVPNTRSPIGHNKTINAFAQSHADKLRNPWEELPEIDSDFAASYMMTIQDYINEIDYWINFSDKNTVNKVSKVTRTDGVLNSVLWQVLSAIPRQFTFNGHTYDILDGIDAIDTAELGTDAAQVPLYNLERLIHRNVAKIAKENDISVVDLVKNSTLLQTMVSGLTGLNNQKSSDITDTLTAEGFTTFDRLQYVITLITEDPAVFFTELKQRVNADKRIAPITIQEFTTRITLASMNQDYRDIFEYAYNLTPCIETYLLANTAIIAGVAGAGKTDVVVRAIDSRIKDEPVIMAGPTEQQATKLEQVLGRTGALTFKQVMDRILGAEQWSSIKAELDAIHKKTGFDSEHFSAIVGSDGNLKLKIKPDTFTFAKTEETPKAIYLDEATHLSTLEIQIIDLYAKGIGAQVFLLGDNTQIGYTNRANGVTNMDEGAVFAVRTPKLTISLRDNNIQKLQNQEKVRIVAEDILQRRLYDDTSEYEAFFPMARTLVSDFKFSVYMGDEINGDLITPELNEATLSLVKKASDSKEKTIAFIGSIESPHLAKLRGYGINISDGNVLNPSTMQGQEYDIVIIDQDFKAPSDIGDMRHFTQTLYTLMTRAREAAIFIDNGLSDIIGTNVMSKTKAKAFSIASAVDTLRANKLAVLDKLDLSGVVMPTTKSSAAAEEESSMSDFTDPDLRPTDKGVIDSVKGTAAEDEDLLDKGFHGSTSDTADLEGFPIECYGDATILGVEEENDGLSVSSWKITIPEGDEELRNLQALVDEDTTINAFNYDGKIALQNQLFNVKSAILFGDQWPTRVVTGTMPAIITKYFNKSDWENGTFEFEIRTPSGEEVTPIGSAFSEIGLEYKGERLIANIIFKVVNKQGRVCKFDIAGVNNPEVLEKNRENIIESLQTRIKNEKTSQETRGKLQKMINGIDGSILAYKNWFDDKVNEFKKNGSLSINVTEAISLTKTTWLRQRTGPAIRLDGQYDPNTVLEGLREYREAHRRYEATPEEERDPDEKEPMVTDHIHRRLLTLKTLNPGIVFSPIYTFSGEECDYYKIDQSIKGKAVVFATSHRIFVGKESSIINAYMAQKGNPNESNPEVRMVVLDNYGLTFSQMTDPDFISHFQSGEETKKPYRQNFTGIRMFVSLWNARAALIKFNDALTKWKGDYKLSDAQVTALLNAQDMRYRGESAETIKEYLNKAGLSGDHHLEILDEFNNERCKDIPMFRLSQNGTSTGYHIQRYNVKDSIMYDGNEANLCAITPEKAAQYLRIARTIMNALCPASGIASKYTLNLSLTKNVQEKDPKDPTKTITREVPWQPDEFIDLEDAKHRRSLSGLLSKDKELKQLQIKNGTEVVAFANGELWSFVPRLLCEITRSVTYYQHNPLDSVDENRVIYTSFDYTSGAVENEKEVWNTFRYPIDEFITGNDAILKDTDAVKDKSLLHFFDLVFHGTNEDVHREYSKDKPLMQLEDAYFKQGFFINPNLNRAKVSAENNKIYHYKGPNGTAVFYLIETNGEFFTSDSDVRWAGVQLNLQKLINPETSTKKVTEGSERTLTEREQFLNTHPEYNGILEVLDNSGIVYEYTEDSVEDAIDRFNQAQEFSIAKLLDTTSPEDVLNTLYTIDMEQGKQITYKESLSRDYPDYEIITRGNAIYLHSPSENETYKLQSNGEFGRVEGFSPIDDNEVDSMFKRSYGNEGKTLGEVLLSTINSNNFSNAAHGVNADDNTIESFREEMKDLVDKYKDNDDKSTNALQEILKKYGDSTLVVLDADLFNTIFDEDCK